MLLYRKKNFFILILGLIFIFIYKNSYATATSNIANILQKKYNSIHCLSTKYIQKLKNHISHEITTRKGDIFVMKKEGITKIRWNTIYPEKEYLFIDNNLVIDYLPSDNIAYKYHLKDVADSRAILNLISGRINISREFSITKDREEEDNTIKYKLIPHNPEPNMVLVYIWVHKKSKLISKIEIIDFFGNTNTISFKDMKINTKLPHNIFIFKANKGTKILEGTPGQ